jgi:hypothetical protein
VPVFLAFVGAGLAPPSATTFDLDRASYRARNAIEVNMVCGAPAPLSRFDPRTPIRT